MYQEYRKSAPRTTNQRLNNNESKDCKHNYPQIKRMPIPVIVPATGPISARTMSPSERPSRRVIKTVGHVLDRTGKYSASKNPKCARQVAHLCCKHRADQGTGAGYGREMMAEKHVPICRT